MKKNIGRSRMPRPCLLTIFFDYFQALGYAFPDFCVTITGMANPTFDQQAYWRTIVKKNNTPIFLLLFMATVIFPPLCLYADQDSGLSNGQTIYVPAYSHIYIGNREQPFLLTITLSIRNVDPKHEMKINLVDYYETQGRLLKRYVDKPVLLKPLESLRYIVPEKDRSGGSGANFIVAWESAELINPPIVETIMVGAQHQQGVSFTSRGKALILHGK